MDKKLALLALHEEAPPSSRRHDARPETTADARARIGQLVAAKYRLDAIIGSGAMGHVYRATNMLIGRTVAIKMLRREHAENETIVERFLREARTANLVQHPNIVDVIDVGTAQDGVPFLVQEYLEGETLLAYAERLGGKLPLTELIEILGPVLSAVAEAHDRNIVHRDLKPENVFLAGKRGRRVPKVLDFGISKARGFEGEITLVGVMMGTPAYMAPELTVSSKDADARTDVWALGVIVFEMLSGQLPFDGDTVVDVLRAVATVDARKLSDVAPHVPVAVSRAVERCLARDPNDRFANARELALELARAFEESAPAAVEAWSLRPSAKASTPPGAMPDMPKPAKLPSEASPTTSTLVDVKMPDELGASASGKAMTLIMDAAAPGSSAAQSQPPVVDASAARAMANVSVHTEPADFAPPGARLAAAVPPHSPSPQTRQTPGPVSNRTPLPTPAPTRTPMASPVPRALAGVETARAKKPRRVSTRALVVLAALVVIVLAEIVIVLKLTG